MLLTSFLPFFFIVRWYKRIAVFAMVPKMQHKAAVAFYRWTSLSWARFFSLCVINNYVNYKFRIKTPKNLLFPRASPNYYYHIHTTSSFLPRFGGKLFKEMWTFILKNVHCCCGGFVFSFFLRQFGKFAAEIVQRILYFLPMHQNRISNHGCHKFLQFITFVPIPVDRTQTCTPIGGRNVFISQFTHAQKKTKCE